MAAPVEMPAGLSYQADVLAPDEVRRVESLLEGLDYEPVVMRGQTALRRVRHFGYRYGYETRAVVPGDPLPDELEWVRERAGVLADVDPAALAEVLVTHYPPGATIGWHRDAPMFGSKVVGISVGSPCTMRFRRVVAGGTQRYRLELAVGSGYVLAAAARWSWQHSTVAITGPRYSLTFRTLRPGAVEDA